MQEEYDEDVIKIEELFTPLVLKCKENGRAMRIGTNHGMFPDRMIFRGFYFL
jgi:(E)-4-hydroxy-3-methylbut-2-enyl-diphosphate synthase